MTTSKKTQVNLISAWLEEFGDKEIQALVKKNVSIANRVIDILSEKNMTRVDFAEKMGKKPSEITKLLSGRHNINMKTIIKMEQALGKDIIEVVGENSNKGQKIVYMVAHHYEKNREEVGGFKNVLIEKEETDGVSFEECKHG